MSEPTFTPSLERLYAELPDHFHRADVQNNYALKRYLSGVTAPLERVEELFKRLEYTPPDDGGSPDSTSDLVDPDTADEAWLPWLAQLLGINPNYVNDETRDELKGASTGFNPGTKNAMIAAGKTALVGEKYIALYDHSSSNGPGTGGEWDVLLVTRDSETLKNLYPEWMSTISSQNNWRYTASAGVVNRTFLVDETFPLWKNRMLAFSVAAYSGDEEESIALPPSNVELYTDYLAPITAGDPFQLMMHVNLVNGGARTISGEFGFRYYAANGSLISSNLTPVTVTSAFTQLSHRVNAPATATTFRTVLKLNGLESTDTVGIAQLGYRRESIKDWISTTADPIRAIIERGAKPAGVILHNMQFAATWDAFQTKYPTWAALDGKTWTEVEESN